MAIGPALSWEILVAGLGHVLIFGVVLVAHCEPSAAPLFKKEDAIQVALAGPPKNDTVLPQKAERAPPPPKATAPDAPAPPPPPNPSDMAFRTPDAPKTKGDPKADAARQKLLDDLRRQQALQDLAAPEGRTDRLASNPEGSTQAGDAPTTGQNDPALAKWIIEARRRVGANWHPLPSICQANPGLTVLVLVDLDGAGKMTEAPTIKQPSGNPSFDEAARRAVEMTQQLGTLPATYPDGLKTTLKFVAKEAL